MKHLLLNDWHFMRFLRLALAVFLSVQAYVTHEWFFIAFAVFFLFQAIFNLGCGPSGCKIPYDKKN
jgi:hypothetical protein